MLSFFKRLFTAFLFLTLATPVFGEGQLVVLMYHRFDAGVSISIPMEKFERQMKYLKDNGYNFVTLPDVKEHLDEDRPFPEKSVLITVDDGYKSTYTKAYPLLKELEIPWVLYPYTKAIVGGYNSYLTWPMIQEMANNGVDVENHSYSHGKFIYDELDEDWIAREITGPHRLLKEKTGQTSESFAIPYGFYDRELIRLFREKTDYDFVFHIDPGVVDPRRDDFFLPRFGLNRSTSWNEFKDKLKRLPLAVSSAYPKRGTRLSETPDTVSITLSNPEKVQRGPINVFMSEYSGPLDWHWDDDGRTIIAEIPRPAKKDWNRLIVTAFDREKNKYRYYSHGYVFIEAHKSKE